MKEIQSFSHVGINVRSLAKSREFYEKLGFKTLIEDEVTDPTAAKCFGLKEWRSVRYAMLALGASPTPTRLDLNEFRDPKYVEGGPQNVLNIGLNRLCFRVSDIHKVYETLKADGIEFISEPSGAGFLLTIARDPDGNYIEFFDQNLIPQYVA